MPRQRMEPGEHGRVTERKIGNRWTATVYVRDPDGRRRRVERSSEKSAEDARRSLQRHLADRRTPVTGQAMTERTTLAELFDLWVQAKTAEDGVQEQTAEQYRAVWRVHGAQQLGALRVTELPTSRANAHLQAMGATTQAKRLRMVLLGMFALAVRFDVLAVNPLRETKAARTTRAAARAVTPGEFEQIRAAVAAYASRDTKPGPKPGRLLPAFVELMAATGCRPNEVLGLRWCDVDLLGDPPTVTVAGTLIDAGRVPGKALYRQDFRKGNAPPHTVVLPDFGVETLTELVGQSGMSGPVFANRDGGWVSLANMRRALRAALPEPLRWVTPYSLRRTVATVVRDSLGPVEAQAQLSHAKLATTEAHYFQRRTMGPDARAALDRFAAGGAGEKSAS